MVSCSLGGCKTHGIFTHSSKPGADIAEQIVEMRTILLIIEAAPTLAEFPALGIALWFQNKPCFEKYL